MRLTIEFDTEWWKVEAWWHRSLCRVFGHPRFEERKPSTATAAYFISVYFPDDDRPRCVRCHAPDPSLPEPEQKTFRYTFTG